MRVAGGAISDHFPLILPIPNDVDTEVSITRKVKLGSVATEEWDARDAHIGQFLVEERGYLNEMTMRYNINDCYNKISLRFT